MGLTNPNGRLRLRAQQAQRIGAIFIFAIAVVGAVEHYVNAVEARDVEIEEARRLSQLERRLAGARGIDIGVDVLIRAREVIRPTDRYAVITGPLVVPSTPVTFLGLPGYANHWLLPRRQTRPEDADWIISYGGDLDALGIDARRTIQIYPGVVLAEVKR